MIYTDNEKFIIWGGLSPFYGNYFLSYEYTNVLLCVVELQYL